MRFLPSGLPCTLKLSLEEKPQRGLTGDGPCAPPCNLALLPGSLQSPGETAKAQRTKERLGGLCPLRKDQQCGYYPLRASLAAQTVKNLLAVQETWVCSLGWEDSPGEKNGNPLQYSWLRNPVDRGAWRATVRGIGKSGTWLSSAFSFTCSLGPKDLFGYIKSM